jgi:acylglycerol lipase
MFPELCSISDLDARCLLFQCKFPSRALVSDFDQQLTPFFMTLLESVFITSRGEKLATYHKKASNTSQRAIVIMHGYAEYVDRYRSFITRLSNEGYHVFALDHHGHGRSEGRRALLRSFDTLVSDASDWFVQLKRDNPDFQWYLFGHSMGGGIAVNLALLHPQDFRGMLLSGPLLLLPDTVPAMVKFVGRIIARLMPWVPLIPIDKDGISRDPGVVRRYLADPMVYSGPIKARTAIEIDQFTVRIQHRLSEITVPFWVGHGSLDRITDPRGSKLLAEKAASEDKTLKIYNGLFHELLNEPEAEIVIHDILHWLRRH